MATTPSIPATLTEFVASSQASPSADDNATGEPVEDSSSPVDVPPVDDSVPPDDAEPKPTPDDTDEPDPRTWVRVIEEANGLDLSKYKSDDDAIRGLGELVHMSGRRDEGNARFQALLEKYGEDRLAAIEAGESDTPEPPPAPEVPSPSSEITPEQYQVWQAQDTAGQLSDADRVKMIQHGQLAQNEMLALAQAGGVKAFEQRITEMVEQRLADGLKQFGDSHTEMTAQQRVDSEEKVRQAAFHEKHGSELFADPEKTWQGKLTPLGQAVADIYQDKRLDKLGETVDRLEFAYTQAVNQQAPVKAPLKPSRAAKREPAVNATAKQTDQLAKMKKYMQEHPNAKGGEVFRALVPQQPETP